MTKDEALKLALEALETERENYRDWGDEDGSPEYIHDAITAIKQALLTATPLAAPYVASQLVQQSRSDVEPVAIVRQKTDAYGGTFIQQYKMLEPNTKLYTTPPAAQRQSAPDPKDQRSAWVGLTDEEIEVVDQGMCGEREFAIMFALTIEAELKAKNSI
jgi:hypothetical protein